MPTRYKQPSLRAYRKTVHEDSRWKHDSVILRKDERNFRIA